MTSVQWLTICAVCYLINVLVPALLSSNETRSSKSEVPPPSVFRTIIEILANIIGGSASSILWVLYGLYMVEFCSGIDPHKKGYYFGVSTAIINLRSILGPILTIFGLGLGNEQIFFGLLSLFALLAIPFPIKCIDPIPLQQPV